MPECVVYDIEGVHISAETLAKHDLPEGKKGRVVALAYELQSEIRDVRQVTCIADRDADALLGKNHSSPLLMMTDWACQEMYFVNEAVISKFLTLVVRSVPLTAHELISNVLPIVQEMHLLRAANLSLKWGMQWLPIAKSCNLLDGRMGFDADGFVEKYLSKASRLGDKAVFLSEVERLRARLTSDALQHASKDDLFSVLAEYLPHYCKETALHKPEYIARSLAGCVEVNQLTGQPLYSGLIRKLKS